MNQEIFIKNNLDYKGIICTINKFVVNKVNLLSHLKNLKKKFDKRIFLLISFYGEVAQLVETGTSKPGVGSNPPSLPII